MSLSLEQTRPQVPHDHGNEWTFNTCESMDLDHVSSFDFGHEIPNKTNNCGNWKDISPTIEVPSNKWEIPLLGYFLGWHRYVFGTVYLSHYNCSHGPDMSN